MNAQLAYVGTTTVIPEWTFADRLRKARSVVGMDQRSFAALLGHKPGAYAQWEADNAKPRDIVELARKIEEVTNVPAAWLLGIVTPPMRPTSGEEGWAPSGSNRRPKD
jgi:transcriptional regulator with XRE-family HTH domain